MFRLFSSHCCAAARQGDDLVPTIDQITKELGFDTFTCHGKHERPPELRVDAVRLYYYAARVGSSLRSALIHRG